MHVSLLRPYNEHLSANNFLSFGATAAKNIHNMTTPDVIAAATLFHVVVCLADGVGDLKGADIEDVDEDECASNDRVGLLHCISLLVSYESSHELAGNGRAPSFISR